MISNSPVKLNGNPCFFHGFLPFSVSVVVLCVEVQEFFVPTIGFFYSTLLLRLKLKTQRTFVSIIKLK